MDERAALGWSWASAACIAASAWKGLLLAAHPNDATRAVNCQAKVTSTALTPSIPLSLLVSTYAVLPMAQRALPEDKSGYHK